MNHNKVTKAIKPILHPQRTHDELYSDALYMFINRIVRGVYNV